MSVHLRQVGLVFAAAVAVLSSQAFAETWAVAAHSKEGVASSSLGSFRRIFADELSAKGKDARVIEPACFEWNCLVEAAQSVGATAIVESELLALGKKLIVRAEVRDTASRQLKGNARMTAANVEELEVIASRLAEALVTGKQIDETADLGNAVKAEDDLGRLRGGRHGFALVALGIVPVNGTYGDGSAGVGLDMAYWFETRHFVLEPRLGFHVDGNGGGPRFFEVPFEVSGYWVPLTGDVSPFIGIGGGLRSIWERRRVTSELGTTLVTTTTADVEDTAWGFGATARAGVILFRTYKLRVLLTTEFSIALLTLNNRVNPRSVRFGAGVVF